MMAVIIESPKTGEDRSTSGLHYRAQVLRNLEVYCYRIAYTLLQNEEWAIKAAKNTLNALMIDDIFYSDNEYAQREKVKSVTINCSLAIYRQQFR